MGIMLVYDVTDGKSFDSIAKWLRNIDEVSAGSFLTGQRDLREGRCSILEVYYFQNANEDVVKMIVGNKCDMEDKRVVPTERGQEVASHHGIPFFETSAKTNVNITPAFFDMTRRILEKQPEKKPEASVSFQTTKPGLNSNDQSPLNRLPSCC